MKVTKKLLLVALILSLILSVGAVTAQDNMTFEKSNLQDISTETNNNEGTLSISNQLAEDETFSLGESSSHNVDGNNFTSIQKSIDSANDGDTVFLDGKNYKGTGIEIQVNKTLTIIGGSQSDPDMIATLDAQKLSRIMNVTADNVIIKGITFINGEINDNYGGAIYWNAQNGKLTNSSFSNNSAHTAGAIYWDGVTGGNISDCSFTDNFATIRAGALYVVNGNYIITDCRFENNHADSDDGGALIMDWCGATVLDCTFTKNYACVFGGAIRNFLSTITVKNNTFENNHADNGGGAIYGFNSNILDSNFKNNSASVGGAVYCGQNTYINNTFFTSNSAENGGAIASEDKALITNNTFKDNDAEFGSTILLRYTKNNITSNYIDNSKSDKCAIHDSYGDNFIENNYFTNPEKNISYGGFFIEFDENYADLAGKTISFPFYVNYIGLPVQGEVSLQRIEKSGNGIFLIQNFGTQTLVNGRASFDINLTSYPDIMHMTAVFNLSSQIISKSFNITVFDDLIGSITQNNGSDDVVIRLISDATGIIMFDANGRNYFAEISNGEAIIEVTGLENGRYAVNLIYSGDDNYPREEKIIVIEVKHAATTVIEVNESFEGFAGKTIEIPVYVHDSLKKPLNGYATLYGYATQELVDGRTTFIITLPDNAAVLSLAVLYEDNVKMTTVTVRDDSIKDIYHNSSDDTVTVELESGATGTVTVKVNGKNYTSIVNNSCSIVDIKDLVNGDYVATVIYSGDENYPKEEKIIILTVKHDIPANPVYKISQNKDINVAYSGKAAYKVLVTMDGKPVTGENVIINFNGKNSNVKTDASGYATLNIDTHIKPGSYSVKATYNGVNVANKVTVKQIIKASDKKVKKSVKTTKVKISLSKVDGKYLKGKTLKVKFNGKTYNVKTNSKGVGIWKVKKSMLKKLKVGKKVKYTVAYGRDTLSKKLTVRK